MAADATMLRQGCPLRFFCTSLPRVAVQRTPHSRAAITFKHSLQSKMIRRKNRKTGTCAACVARKLRGVNGRRTQHVNAAREPTATTAHDDPVQSAQGIFRAHVFQHQVGAAVPRVTLQPIRGMKLRPHVNEIRKNYRKVVVVEASEGGAPQLLSEQKLKSPQRTRGSQTEQTVEGLCASKVEDSLEKTSLISFIC